MKKLLLFILLTAGFCCAATVNICSTATCNGTTDDTAAVQAAINGSSNGDTILWTGTTKVTSQITGLSNRTFQGTGGGIVGSISNQLFLCNACSNTTITGLTFNGGGILINSGGSTVVISNNLIENITTASDYTMDGIHVYAGTTGLLISGNTLTNIHDSRSTYSSGCGAIWLFDAASATVTGNIISQTCQAFHYTANQTDSNLTVTNNTIHGTQRYSIEVQGSFSVNNQNISGNWIDTPVAGINGQAGISSAAGGTGSQIRNNTLYGPNLGNPSNQSDAIEAMGAGFIISGNTAGHWGEAQLIGNSDNTWQTTNNTWCDMNYPSGGPSLIVLESGGMAPGTNSGNTYTTLCPGATPVTPTLPRSVPSGVRPTPTGSTIQVHAGDNLQTVYNAASCGQDLVLDAGSSHSGVNLVLNKQCTPPNWILVEGQGCHDGTVPIPQYVTTATANLGPSLPFPPPSLANYATLISNAGVAVITTTDSMGNAATGNYFGCLEVKATTFEYQLIDVSNNGAETLASQLGNNIIFDRMYPHGYASEATNQVRRGFFVTGGNVAIVNSYVSNIYDSNSDSQAIGLGGGPGPYLFQNDFLSASTEIIMPGGGGPNIGYTCTIAASPAPTPTSATVNTCIDAASGSVATPAIGTTVMFYTSASTPFYTPLNYVTITGNTAGALTFPAIPSPPLSGAGKVQWGITPDDATLDHLFLWKDPCWNPADPCYDHITRSSKDFWENKEGHRWLGNAIIFANTFNQGQQYAFNWNSADQNGGCPWCATSDITFQNFIVKNTPGNLSFISTQGGAGSCPGLLNRVLVQNGIFFPPGSGSAYNPSGGRMLAFTRVNGGCSYPQPQASDSIQINHVTMPGGGSLAILSDDNPFNFPNLNITNNIQSMDQFRYFLVSGGCTDPCFSSNAVTSGKWTLAKNAIINEGAINGGQGVSDSALVSKYSTGILSTLYDTTQALNYSTVPFASYSTVYSDYHGFALTGSGPWRNAASDGTDPGVNLSALDTALGTNSSTGTVGSSITITGTVTVP